MRVKCAGIVFRFCAYMKKHVNIKVSGKVQGVFFRASTQETADAFQVKGFVRNEPDGSVYIEAEAPEEKLEQFIQWCRRGPARANVQECKVVEGTLKNFSRFVVDR